MITPIEAYATSDGKMFPRLVEAQAHQHGIDIKKQVEEHLGMTQELVSYGAYTQLSAIIDWEVTKKLKELEAA